MRGIKRYDKDIALAKLREGKSPVQVSKQLKIPLSTITTWLNNERKKQASAFLRADNRIQAIANADSVNTAEANIVNIITPYLTYDISDSEWMNVQTRISNELKKMAFKLLRQEIDFNK